MKFNVIHHGEQRPYVLKKATL